MKIIDLFVILLFMIKIFSCFEARINPSIKISSNPETNFFQISNNNVTNLKNSPFIYNAKVYIITKNDKKDDKPQEIKTEIILGKNSIFLLENGKIKNHIPYVQ
jgi:hypothetical protein